MCSKNIMALFVLVNLVNINCEMKKSWNKVSFKSAALSRSTMQSARTSEHHPELTTLSNSYSKYLDEHIKTHRRHDLGRTEHFSEDNPSVWTNFTKFHDAMLDKVDNVSMNETLKTIHDNLEDIKQHIEADLDGVEVEDDDSSSTNYVGQSEEAASDEGEDLSELDENENNSLNKTKLFESYHILPGVDVDMFKHKNLVNFHFDTTVLKDVFQGRGRKYNMLERVVPLLILPFLIQSAVVPFIVTKIKLLLFKSVLVGKFAVFLLLIGALKNFKGTSQAKAVPYYNLSDAPSSFEMSDAERKSAFDPLSYGHYKVDGKPAMWVH